eukprot:1140294-Pelagomonas_calceolata.AAC.7
MGSERRGMGRSWSSCLPLVLYTSGFAVALSEAKTCLCCNFQGPKSFALPAGLMHGTVTCMCSSPVLAVTTQATLETLRGMSPSVIRQVAPVIEQLAPIYLDLAQGRMEFSPTPEEARHLMQTYYSECQNAAWVNGQKTQNIVGVCK